MSIFGRKDKTEVGKTTSAAVAQLSPVEKIEQNAAEWQAAMEKLAANDFGLKLARMYRLMLLEARALVDLGNQGCDNSVCNAERSMRLEVSGKLLNAMAALKEGFSLCTPSAEWYAGLVHIDQSFSQAQKAIGGSRFVPFPSKNAEKVRVGVKGYKDELGATWYSIYYFTGLIPTEVMPKYTRARTLFGWPNIHVYSPREEDFKTATIPAIDPMMIGRIQDVPGFGTLYFRIATWDLSADLKAIFEEKSQ